ncbi:hypothetical protein LCM10_04030 [Rossellomorea aquimaris]|uniref:hypothetical protein n=1 Tax=Rossellomorea aquimaris TaxID=189382 RepID=UPI001CD6A80F|nr:hypothetical protein [Rossellomorea aquimaris]MCA1054145.1 hypothetical protein [Rossellomorea aquimaris]
MDKKCPDCQVDLFEDYSEEVFEQEDGSMMLDTFPAWVCMNHCGYYERIETFEVIAQRDDDCFLLLYEGEEARILDLRDRILFPPMNVHAILSKGYWEDVRSNRDIGEEMKNIKRIKEWNR